MAILGVKRVKYSGTVRPYAPETNAALGKDTRVELEGNIRIHIIIFESDVTVKIVKKKKKHALDKKLG